MPLDSPQQPRTAECFPPRTVHDLVARQAAHHPEATAVIAGERRTSYRELLALAARISALLPSTEWGRTGICLGRDERTVAAFLGVWRAGRSCVALDPSL
ncbi:AMP-binding protein, partial [Streptomyces sp. CLV115]|uniref:AMP-binding protein n=1 Tax=Streptomyces sp. CLV115 TaxID=3138502 RepID=UPI00313C1BA8